MTHYDYLIIGGGIAGVTAAETIREKKPVSTIGIISDEKNLIYSRVLLPTYLKKKVRREQLFLRKPEDFTKKNIDYHLDQAAAAIDSTHKEVHLESGLVFRYEKLLIASGGRVKPWGKEEDQKFIFRLQTIDDADRLKRDITALRQPLVVGSSFISLEFIEIFFLNDIKPILISRDSHFFGRIFEERGGELLYNNFRRHGISELFFKDAIREVTSSETAVQVSTQRLQLINCDAIALGIGIERNREFLGNLGIELGATGIKTNEFLETNVVDIYAAGDIAEYFDLISESYGNFGNWTSAFLQGKRVGLNMAGERAPFITVPTYSITNLGLQITSLGTTIVDDQTQSIVRIDPEKLEYERLFLKKGVLAGAVLVNRFRDKAHITKLIESMTDLSQFEEKLKTSEFDIREIPLV